MTTLEKIKYLIQIGIPIKTIAKYANYNDSYLSKYLKDTYQVSNKCLNAIETGIIKLIQDMEMVQNE